MTVHRFQSIPELRGKTVRAVAFVIREDGTGPGRKSTAELDLVFTDGTAATISCSGAEITVTHHKEDGK